MTALELKTMACSTLENAQIFLPYLTETFKKYEILTPERQLCFIAQVSHESGGFFYTEELASGATYEGRADLGNTQPGDGIRFKGRGLIQITGRANYQLLSHALQEDFITHPELVGGKNSKSSSPAQLRNAALSAGWFWNRANLNHLADEISPLKPIDQGINLECFKTITRKINGGYNGLADRLHRYTQGISFIQNHKTLV